MKDNTVYNRFDGAIIMKMATAYIFSTTLFNNVTI